MNITLTKFDRALPTAPPMRRGLAAVEVLAAVAILSIVLGLAAKMSMAISGHRKMVEQHRIILDANINLMNYAMALPYEQLTKSQLESFATELASIPEDWEVSVEEVPIEDLATSMRAKRISIDLNATEKPLVAWRYPVSSAEAESTFKGEQE